MATPRVPDPLGLRAWGRRAGRQAAAGAADAAGRGGVAILERALAWRYTEEGLDVLLGSPAAERAVRTLADGPLPDLAVRALVRHGIAGRVAEELLAEGVAAQLAERLLAGPELDAVVCAVVDDPRTHRLLVRLLESEGMDRLVAEVLESRLADAAVTRLLAGDELWRVVGAVVGSETVTGAITRQGAGLADQVAGELGERSRRADARLERAVGRLLHRRRDGARPTAAGDGSP
ncbi:MAG TPA: hypothetical protein VFR97_14390 [Capillimicrobium sp.]|nr:hypothetical protein [Capillimicrobium sp.]